MRLVLGALLGLMLAGAARADSVWTYEGNSLSDPVLKLTNPCNCGITGTVTMSDDWRTLSYSFTDGTHSFTSFNSTGGVNPFGNDGLFPFDQWTMYITRPDGWTLHSYDYGSQTEQTDSVANLLTREGWSYVQGNEGEWELVSTLAATYFSSTLASTVFTGSAKPQAPIQPTCSSNVTSALLTRITAEAKPS